MNWGSWSNFFAMGGYALYVWGSYVVTALVLVAEVILVFQRRRTLLKHLSLIRSLRSGEQHETSA